MGGPASTTTTTTVLNPSAPVLNAITGLPDPAGETQIPLSWSQPAGGAAVTSYSIEYSTSASFPAGNFSVVSLLSPSITNYTVTSLTANTTYYFEIIAYAGANSAQPRTCSRSRRCRSAAPTCTLGQLNVTGATSLSTTGTILQTNGKMSENLTLVVDDDRYVSARLRRAGVDPTAMRRSGLAVHVGRRAPEPTARRWRRRARRAGRSVCTRSRCGTSRTTRRPRS